MKHNPLPDAERLLQLFSYDPKTGNLKWLVRRKGVKADMIAGTPSRGYIVVRIDGVLYFAHRVIWKFVTGEDPLDQIDHEDLDRSNNKWSNLRQADNSKNMMNIGLTSQNTSGIKGVFWDSYAKAWRARIKLNGKSHHVGLFSSIDAAAIEIQFARERLHGEFARAA